MSVSTHVLDTARGRPAAEVPVRLEALADAEWRVLDRTVTDTDGRVRDRPTGAGIHRLVFDVTAYHGESAFYPEIVVTFRVTDPTEHHHVPLLLSFFGYSSYRGS